MSQPPAAAATARPSRAGRRGLSLAAALIALVALPALAAACPPGRGDHRRPHALPDCRGGRVGPVQWEVRSSHPAVHWRGSGRVLVEVRLRADRLPAAARQPIAVALVLDRSGSMQGRKWEDAAEAARAAIRRLEPGDIVTLVSYASDVSVDWPARVFERRHERELLAAIDRMRPTGSTYLEGGLRRGAEQLARAERGERPTRVLLVSDGNANVGVQSGEGLLRIARKLAADGVQTTTIGLGTDYNEDTMTAIADGGAGSYFYVRDAHRLGEAFGTELERMLTTAARQTRLRLQPAAGVRIAGVLGYAHEPTGDGGVEIPLGDLASDSERSVLVELEVRCDGRGRQRLASVELAFRDREGETRRGYADLDVEATDDPRRVERERDLGVLGRHEEHKLAEEMRASAERVRRGEGAAARQRLQAAAKRAREVARKSGSAGLGRAADEADRRAEAAPAAAQRPAQEREHYKKSLKARAYQMSK
jgi:Ca-activated chloride channel family protein